MEPEKLTSEPAAGEGSDSPPRVESLRAFVWLLARGSAQIFFRQEKDRGSRPRLDQQGEA